MENLSVTSKKDVTIVLIYDSPRIGQWASIWREQSKSYEDFLCNDNEVHKLYEYVDTTMNPFKVASVYREQGWKVIVIDEDGIRKSGLDPAHSIACNVLKGVTCVDGWVDGLQGEISTVAIEPYGIGELDEDSQDDLEQLFV